MTDEELMRAVAEGDQKAYQQLVRAHLNAISHYAYRLLGNRKDVEDICQEVFLKMWLNSTSWQAERSRLSTWLHRIAHNLCIDYLRRHGRTEMSDELPAEPTGLSKLSEGHGEELQQDLKRLDIAISRLPEKQRCSLALCHYAGFSNQEAADIMNLSLKALESNIARARRSLREQFEGSQIAAKQKHPYPQKQ